MSAETTSVAVHDMLASVEARWGKDAGAAVREYSVVIGGLGVAMIGLDYSMKKEAVEHCRRAAQCAEHCAGLLLVGAAAPHVPSAEMADFVKAAMKIAARPLIDTLNEVKR